MSRTAPHGGLPAPLRVLHLLSGQERGGILRVVEAIAADRQARGGEAFIGTLGGRGDSISSGRRVVRFGRRRTLDPWAAARLLAFSRREAITIVHTHNVTANLYGLLLSLLRPQLLHVIHVHAHFQQILLESQRSRVKRYLLLRGNALALRACDGIIANSNSVKGFLVDYGADPEKIAVVHNGVDVSRLVEDARLPCPHVESLTMPRGAARPGAGDGRRTRLVGAFGRLAPVKNYPVFLEAARLVLEKEPATFVIAGDGPERNELERLAGRLGIAERVHFAGWVQNPYPLLASMDVVVLTSIAEGFGLVLLEAMALERPVITTAAGAVTEVVRDGETGIVVPAADPASLAAAILRLLRDPSLGQALGARGREVARAEFSDQTMCDRAEQVYVSAMKRQWRGAPMAHA
jgi:glycosyltransferase involved in cell wall biosynthesis